MMLIIVIMMMVMVIVMVMLVTMVLSSSPLHHGVVDWTAIRQKESVSKVFHLCSQAQIKSTISKTIKSDKETPTCLVIFLILRKLKTKPNGPLGSSTQAELTIVSTSQTKHLIL